SKTLGLIRLGNEIGCVKQLFKYAFDEGYIPSPVRFGQGFKKPSRKSMRIDRAKKGTRMFEAEEIQRMLKVADVQLKAMILLGVNCGFGNHDCGTLPISALDLAAGWVNFHRPKTGVSRRCKLWPETATAIRAVLADESS